MSQMAPPWMKHLFFISVGALAVAIIRKSLDQDQLTDQEAVTATGPGPPGCQDVVMSDGCCPSGDCMRFRAASRSG